VLQGDGVMYSEEDTIKRFIDFLKERGYPENTLVTNYNIKQGYHDHADVAVLSQNKNGPIQIFELKRIRNERSTQNGIATLKKCRSILNDESIPASIIFSEEKSQYFEVIDLDNPKDVMVTNEDNKKLYAIFDYKSHENKHIQRLKDNVVKNEKRTTDYFIYLSWSFCVVVAIIAACSIHGCIQIDSKDLVLIAYCIGLVLAPFVSKMKILGIEFERLSKHDETCLKKCANFSSGVNDPKNRLEH